jgi:hypothetical protein
VWEAGGTLSKSCCRCVGVRAAEFSAGPADQLLVCLLALVAACFLVQPATAAQVKEVRLVLFLNARGPSSRGVPRIEQEIRAALQKSPYQVEIYREYLETRPFSDAAFHRKICEWYIRKYRDQQPGLIIVDFSSGGSLWSTICIPG